MSVECSLTRQRGFTLMETLVAMAISAILLLELGGLLPLLVKQHTGLQQRQQLRMEMQRITLMLEKAIRRAGYCHGEGCQGLGLEIQQAGQCLLVRWDGQHKGRWRGTAHPDSDYYGYRYRNLAIEAKRGVDSCQGSHWQQLTEPQQMQIVHFQLRQQSHQVVIDWQAQIGQYALQQSYYVQRQNR